MNLRFKSYLLIAFAAILLQSCGYNTMVEKDETVGEKWSQVETQYQRRADLIPNLVSTVKGYAAHEKETLEAVVEARAKATSVNIDANKLDAASMQQFQAAQSGLSSALSKLLVVVEKYPDLKANQNFLELQAQLEGTENRIAVARKKFNESVKDYNAYIRKFKKTLLQVGLTLRKKLIMKQIKVQKKHPR